MEYIVQKKGDSTNISASKTMRFDFYPVVVKFSDGRKNDT